MSGEPSSAEQQESVYAGPSRPRIQKPTVQCAKWRGPLAPLLSAKVPNATPLPVPRNDPQIPPERQTRNQTLTSDKNRKRHHDRVKTEGPHAAASAFLGVFSFLGAAAFLGAAFLGAAGLAAVFATRPDLVLVRTVAFSTTAGAEAWRELVSRLEAAANERRNGM